VQCQAFAEECLLVRIEHQPAGSVFCNPGADAL